MNINKLPAKNKNGDFNVIIEIPMQSSTPVKYEFDKDLAAPVVDRIMQTAMYYPANYGFIPNTLSKDGDPVDVLVYSYHPIITGAVVAARPIGVLEMEDESGMDEKILAVPAVKIDSSMSNIQDIEHIDEMLRGRIANFFENYKKLEKGKWVKIAGWADKARALELINEALERVA